MVSAVDNLEQLMELDVEYLAPSKALAETMYPSMALNFVEQQKNLLEALLV